MEMEFRQRNNDLGVCIPTFQERVNTMLPTESSVNLNQNTQAAKALEVSHKPVTPHMLSSTEVEQTLTLMETEAQNQNAELLRIHAGLDKQRVAHLLSLLQD